MNVHERNWEAWSSGAVDYLESIWGKPDSQRGRHWELIFRVASLVSGGSVLDVGCGMGHLYSCLKHQNKQIDYLGVDSSASMIEKAHLHFLEEQRRFQWGDVFDLSSIPKSDIVVAVDLLIHLPEIKRPLLELWSRTIRECIFTLRIADEKHFALTKPGYISKEKTVIVRIDLLEDLYRILAQFDDLGAIERFFFDSRTEIFRLKRGIPKPKPHEYSVWTL